MLVREKINEQYSFPVQFFSRYLQCVEEAIGDRVGNVVRDPNKLLTHVRYIDMKSWYTNYDLASEVCFLSYESGLFIQVVPLILLSL